MILILYQKAIGQAKQQVMSLMSNSDANSRFSAKRSALFIDVQCALAGNKKPPVFQEAELTLKYPWKILHGLPKLH